MLTFHLAIFQLRVNRDLTERTKHDLSEAENIYINEAVPVGS